MTTFWIVLAVTVIYFSSLGWRARREQPRPKEHSDRHEEGREN